MKEDQKQKHGEHLSYIATGFAALAPQTSSGASAMVGIGWPTSPIWATGFNLRVCILQMFCGLRCAFNVNESKMSTARLVGFLQLRIQRVYTVPRS